MIWWILGIIAAFYVGCSFGESESEREEELKALRNFKRNRESEPFNTLYQGVVSGSLGLNVEYSPHNPTKYRSSIIDMMPTGSYILCSDNKGNVFMFGITPNHRRECSLYAFREW